MFVTKYRSNVLYSYYEKHLCSIAVLRSRSYCKYIFSMNLIIYEYQMRNVFEITNFWIFDFICVLEILVFPVDKLNSARFRQNKDFAWRIFLFSIECFDNAFRFEANCILNCIWNATWCLGFQLVTHIFIIIYIAECIHKWLLLHLSKSINCMYYVQRIKMNAIFIPQNE